jgi:hypothetical protein
MSAMVKITGKMLLIRMPNHTHHYLRKIKNLLTSNYFNHIFIYTHVHHFAATIYSFLTEMGVRYVTVKRMPGVGTNSLKV